MNTKIISLTEQTMNCKAVKVSLLGKGASASVYRVDLDSYPYCLAVKISDYPSLVIDEYNRIDFIQSRVDCKLPKLYFAEEIDGKGVLAMELIEGMQASRKSLMFRPNKKKLANEIVDNLIKIHSVHNEKYGPIDKADYDTWYEYYSVFAKEIVDFTDNSDVPKIVKQAVNEAYKKLDRIIENSGEATLTHGDYWLPNFIVDTKTMSLSGVIDPFNVMWTEPEYELFTLTVGYGKNLHLYDIYKSKVKTSKNCDTKVEMYALFNELLWYKSLGKIGVGYLIYRSKRLLKALGDI